MRTGSFLLLSALLLFCAGFFAATQKSPSPQTSQSDETEKRDREEEIETLRALPYAQWTDKDVDISKKGVTSYDRNLSYAGYNLYTNIENEIYLIDMLGKKIHTWLIPGKKRKCLYSTMLDNGDILAMCQDEELIKLDWNSRVLWEKKAPIHHDVEVMSDHSYVTILKDPPRVYKSYSVTFDSLLLLSESGKELNRWSTFENHDYLKEFHPPSPLDDADHPIPHWLSKRNGAYDYYHLNTVKLLPETPLGKRDKRFRAGNFLICFRNVSLIAILDKISKKVVWSWGSNILEHPHLPVMLNDGNILIFDNGVWRKYSKVLEINPVSGKIVWEYRGDPPKSFYSAGQGSAQRLPNGNTLICDSYQGHVFEINAQRKIVWDFWNPLIQNGKRKTIYRFIRLPKEHVDSLFKKLDK